VRSSISFEGESFFDGRFKGGIVVEGIFNLVEGLWWMGLGMGLLLRTSRQAVSRCLISWLAVILILFGLSDFVEIFSGAWWRPWWLAVWKAACLTTGILLLIFLLRKRRKR
jgi:hypothetical protein